MHRLSLALALQSAAISGPAMSLVVFQKTLHDLVKGIRAHKKDPSLFISQAIAEIKQELKSNDPFVKAQAVRKLTYLQMIGYDVSWAAFSIVEVMSQPRFAHKRIAYLAACQSFTDDTDVILLTTNLFKKEFTSSNQYDVGLAINCVANIVNKDLARDLLSDMVSLMTHSKPYVRKKAVLAMYKVYVKYPQALRLTFEKLKEQLEDADSSVVSCAVNVICELANKNPRNYLAMAPKFFRLLTTSSNNWMLIKVVKLLGSLVADEPRLARKLLEPLATIIQNTAAKSLQYECIHTVTLALPFTKREDGTEARNVPAVVRLCADHLRSFVEDPDQNLKYLGLVGFVNLMRSHPRTVVEHRQLVLRCLHDDDVTIRTRALELLTGMVTRRSLQELVNQLMQHVKVAEGYYKDELISKILFMCSRDKYSFLTDFAWYISILVELASVQGLNHGPQVAEQLVEVALRVDTTRPYLVECMLPLLLDNELCLGAHRDEVGRILQAAAWAVSEYSEVVTEISRDTAPDDVDDDEDSGAYWIEGPANEEVRSDWRGRNLHVELVDALLHPRVTNLAPYVQATYLQAAFKLFLRACQDCGAEVVSEMIQIFKNTLGVFLQSMDLEVQERATALRYLLSEFHILTFEQHDVADGEPEAQEVKREPAQPPAPEPLLLLDSFVSLMDTAQHKSAYNSLAGLQSQDAPSLAKQQVSILRALVAEPCYAVNPKAQKRVPAPEDMNLELPFNQLAVDAIVSSTEPEPKDLASVSFTVLPTRQDSHRDVLSPVNKSSASRQYEPVGEDERRMSQLLGEAFEEDAARQGGVTSPRHSEKSSKSSRRDKDAELFYLRSAHDSGKAAVVLDEDRQLMSFEDEAADGGRSGRSKSKKGTRKSKKRSTAQPVTVAELMPEGAVESSDEEEGSRMVRSKPKTRRPKRNGNGEEDIDLGDVDVTVPLREDEVIPVARHRSPRIEERAPAEASAKAESAGIKSKTKKKKKKGAGEEGGSSRKADTEVDLLGFAPVDSETKPTSPADDLMGLTMPAPKKSKQKTLWLPIGEMGDIVLAAAVQFDDAARQLLIRFRGTHAGQAPAIAVEFSARSLPTGFASPQGSSLNATLAQRVEKGTEFEATVALSVSASPLALCAGTELSGTFRYAVESLVGERFSAPLNVSIPCAAFLRPLPLSESSFMDMLASSSDWSRSTARVAYSGKVKSTFKALGGFLHAHAVESEETKAVSFSATHWAGATVAVLCKRQSDSVVAVDIKCRGAGAPQLAQSLAAELSHLVL